MHKTRGSSPKRNGRESRGPVFGFCPDSEAESGQSKPYLSLCYCLAASIPTKRALFWTVQQDQQIQDSKKEGAADARESERERDCCSTRLAGTKEIPSPTLSDVWPNLGFHCCEGLLHWP